ncbi:hypothetical protein J4447_01540 [Candidatus Pacearchaeota archaeon]|nr:hypothetical protein [Candidatus Pacearchaeota archaeon]
MNLEEFKKRLSKYSKEDIIFTDHSEIQAIIREADPDIVTIITINRDWQKILNRR